MYNLKFGCQSYPWKMGKHFGQLPRMLKVAAEAGIVCIILFVGIYYRNGSMLSVGRSGDPCGVLVERKVLDSDLFHVLVSFFK